MRLERIDDISIKDHYYLTPSDECWYFGEYTAYRDWSFSETNQLVKNFKKRMSLRGTSQWRHKQVAIKRVGKLFADVIGSKVLNDVIFIPIPPSKVKTDPEYDPRIINALEIASDLLEQPLPIFDCIEQAYNTDPDHESDDRRLPPEERAHTYNLDKSLIPPSTTLVVLVDDMITTGSHFKGAEILIKEVLPNTKITGLFLSRRVHENPFDNVDFSNLTL